MRKTVVINAVGLTPNLLKQMPKLSARAGGRYATIGHVWPAVTCSVQATYLTGKLPREHGIVGNGWFFRDTQEVRFWQQSDRLVEAPRIWELGQQRDAKFTCANFFWWHSMYSSATYTVTPRPMYPADGRKIPDLWTDPPVLRDELQAKLGQFPLFKFWGPATSFASTQWIADLARLSEQLYFKNSVDLSLIYLPHLDYNLQRLGPDDPKIELDLRELDACIDSLWDYFVNVCGFSLIVLSEYGIEPVDRPVHLNRVLRENGLLSIREELGREYLDAGASRAFAVADHQVAHVYIRKPDEVAAVKQLLAAVPGVARVMDRDQQRELGIDHARSGELVAIAEPGAWFTYYFWLDDAVAPDYARTVDIHRKPGYDPCELFYDPKLTAPKLRAMRKVIQRKLGFRSLLDVIPLDATLVKGSHGRPPATPERGPLLISSDNISGHLAATDICQFILDRIRFNQ